VQQVPECTLCGVLSTSFTALQGTDRNVMVDKVQDLGLYQRQGRHRFRQATAGPATRRGAPAARLLQRDQQTTQDTNQRFLTLLSRDRLRTVRSQLCRTGENGQPFRRELNSDFGPSRTPISGEAER
jgi:hypothetical protein